MDKQTVIANYDQLKTDIKITSKSLGLNFPNQWEKLNILFQRVLEASQSLNSPYAYDMENYLIPKAAMYNHYEKEFKNILIELEGEKRKMIEVVDVKKLQEDKKRRDLLEKSKDEAIVLFKTLNRIHDAISKASIYLTNAEKELLPKTNLESSMLHRIIGIEDTLLLNHDINSINSKISLLTSNLKKTSDAISEFDHEVDVEKRMEEEGKMTVQKALVKLTELQDICDNINKTGKVRTCIALSNYMEEFKNSILSAQDKMNYEVKYVEDLELNRIEDPTSEIIELGKEVGDLQIMLERKI